MRLDTPAFAVANQAPAKSPRLVIRHIFDIASIYVTSDPGMINVPGTALLGHLQGVSAVSQEINPDEARSTIGSLAYTLVDIESDFTDALRDQLQTQFQNLRGITVELRLGYTNDYNATKVLFTQQVKGVSYEDGTYNVTCNDIQRELRKDVFDPLLTTLRLSVAATDSIIPVQDTTGFQRVRHGPSYSDAPNATVGYFRLEDEIIRYTGTTADSFQGCTRGVFNTIPAAHAVETGADDERQPEVEEFIYLELPGPKLAYAILTGVLHNDSATLPDHWHLGVATSHVTVAKFEQIGLDLWNITDDDATLLLRFSGLQKTDGKRFLEEQVYQPLGVYSPVLNDGTLGLRRMNQILADAPAVMILNEDSFTQVGALEHDFDSLLNFFEIDWNFDPIAERFTRRRAIIDQASMDLHGEADKKLLAWEGLHGSRHTDAVLLQRSDSLRDRYAGPPLRLTGNLLHSYNVLEVGDVVRVQLEHVRDYTGDAGPIDRSFEVQRISVDQISGQVSVSLFGSTQSASVLPPGSGTALPDIWYQSAGTELSTVVTISGGVITAGTYNLTGHADVNNGAAVYYYLGALELASTATLTVNNNVQLRIMGHFTVNGAINGVGRGKAGKIDDDVFANTNAGTAGYIGSTRGWEGLNYLGEIVNLEFVKRWTAPQADGLHTAFPFLELSVAGGNLVGLPTDIRGTSGGIGGRIVDNATSVMDSGGTGGASGAGLVIVSRGGSFGASGSINVSGGDSALGESSGLGDQLFRAGSGAPGGPGGVLWVVDGSGPSLPDVLSKLTAAYGAIPSAGNQPVTETGDGLLSWQGLADPLAGYNTSIGGDITASVLRIQRLAPEQVPQQDVAVIAPLNLAAVVHSSGRMHTLTNSIPPPGVITEYFASTTNLLSDAVPIGSSISGVYVHEPQSGATVYYWARNRSIATRLVSAFSPHTSTTTVIGTALVAQGSFIEDPNFDLSLVIGGGSDIFYNTAVTGMFWIGLIFDDDGIITPSSVILFEAQGVNGSTVVQIIRGSNTFHSQAAIETRHRIKSNATSFDFHIRYRTSVTTKNFFVAVVGSAIPDGLAVPQLDAITEVDLPNTASVWTDLILTVSTGLTPFLYYGFRLGLSDNGGFGGIVQVDSVFVYVTGQPTIENDGTPLAQRQVINFTGTGVTAADTAGKTVVTVGGSVTSPKLCIPFQCNAGTTLALTDQANAEQFLDNSNRNIKRVDLTDFTQYRLYARITTASASANTPRFYAQYHTSFDLTPGTYSPLGASGDVNLSLAATGGIVTAWTNIAAGAKADIFLVVLQNGGDAVADPAIGHVEVQFR